MKFIATADWHLWPTIWKKFPSIEGDSEVAVKELLSRAREDEMPVLCAGDIMDHGEQGGVSRELLFLAQNLTGIPFYYIVGNHEESGYTAGHKNPAWLESLAGAGDITHLGGVGKYTRIGEYMFGGIDYQRGSLFRESVERYKKQLKEDNVKLDVLLIHQALEETLGYEGAFQATSDELKDLAKLIVVGDVHTPAVWEVDDTVFLSPGSTVRNNWGEIDFKDGVSVDDGQDMGYYIVTLSGPSGECSVDYEHVIITDRRRFYDFDAMTPGGEAYAIKTIEAAPEPSEKNFTPLCKVVYPADHESFISRIKGLCEKKGIQVDLRPRHTVSISDRVPVDLLDEEDELDYEKLVDMHVDENNAELKKIILEILTDPTERPDQVLERFVK